MTEAINISGVPSLPAVSNGIKVPASAKLVYCSGQIHSRLKEDGSQEIIQGSATEKTKLIFENLEKVLKAGGSSLQQLVKVNIYITSYDFFNEMNEQYVKMIPDPKPPRTCVQVAGLPFGSTIEVEAIGWAHDNDKGKI